MNGTNSGSSVNNTGDFARRPIEDRQEGVNQERVQSVATPIIATRERLWDDSNERSVRGRIDNQLPHSSQSSILNIFDDSEDEDIEYIIQNDGTGVPILNDTYISDDTSTDDLSSDADDVDHENIVRPFFTETEDFIRVSMSDVTANAQRSLALLLRDHDVTTLEELEDEIILTFVYDLIDEYQSSFAGNQGYNPYPDQYFCATILIPNVLIDNNILSLDKMKQLLFF